MTATGWSALISLIVAIVVLAASYAQWWDIGFNGQMWTRRWVKRLFAAMIVLLVIAAVLLVVGQVRS